MAMKPTLLALGLASLATAACNNATLNTTIGNYPITTYPKTIASIAAEVNRGICDIGRANQMADVSIVPNIGQELIIPAQVCDPDNTSCLLPNVTSLTETCVKGGPRLYYTVSGDYYEVIAQRLNITVEAIMSGSNASTTDLLPVGEFVKVPLCDPSECTLQPYSFTEGVYADLAKEYGSTVGQIMMLSPTYNYSRYSVTEGQTPPTIVLPINCTDLSSNITVIT